MPNESTIQTLGALQDAIGVEEFDDAGGLLKQLADRYNSTRGAETALREKVVSTRTRIESDDLELLNTLIQFVQTQSATSTGRAGVLVGTRRFLVNPESGSATDIQEQITDLRAQEETFLKVEASASTVIENDVQFPAKLVVTHGQLEEGSYITNKGYELVMTVENVGDEPVDAVSIEAETPDMISTTPTLSDVGSLSPGESADATFTIAATDVGDYTISVNPSIDDTIEIQSNAVCLTVVDSSTLSERALNAFGMPRISKIVMQSRAGRDRFCRSLKRPRR